MKKRVFLFLTAAVVLLAVGFTLGYFVTTFTFVQKYCNVPVIDAPIKDQAAFDKIVLRINQEGIKTSISKNGLVQVADKTTARRMRAILIREDLIPSGVNPWAIFDMESWTTTDMERGVRLQRALTQEISMLIKAIDDIDDAKVKIVWPDKALFRADQNPVSASVVISSKPGSDIVENRKKIEGIQRILKTAIEGLLDENIVIADQEGLILNDFYYLAGLDNLVLIERKARLIQKLEAEYSAIILNALQKIFSSDQVHNVYTKIDMDYDMINETNTFTLWERNPQINRVTVSVNIDGTWKWKYNEKGKPVVLFNNTIEREYIPVPPEQLSLVTLLLKDAIGYNSARGDSVTVLNIPINRTKQFSEEDAAYFKKKQMQMTVIIIPSGLTLLLISFIIFRVIAREMERRRRLVEKE